ncbi:lipoate--protein ligase family protein [Sinomonas sp. ASV486]|uniref:lipoate--protein ligase family protein n=1 Tax=Sinomonas sp. ASV486 TaxID=3051170 RepID=UPI0027DB2542|nr:lipoate--protein ligase family protein [Sinomonas sp. ASV486]MDQ4491517.1 lipoate--protein ligase family protein [Sinomonas sp. ASV486]
MAEWNDGESVQLGLVRGSGVPDGGSGAERAAAELAHATELLDEVKRGVRGATLRLYRPRPTLAFGQRDTRLAGFDAARDAARAHGFEPVVRKAGGRAAAYHEGTLIVDHIEPAREAMVGHRHRFEVFGALYAGVLQALGVDARVGEIPGEYCPGEYSVHGVPVGFGTGTAVSGRTTAAGRLKLVGTAQRVVAGAWLFSSVFVVSDAEPVRAVLTDVYRALALPFDPATAGAADDLVPGLTVDAVETALLAMYRERGAVA